MRKLAVGTLSFSVAVFLSCYLLPVKVLPAAIALSFLIVAVLLLLRKDQLRAFIISGIGLCLGFSCFYVKYNIKLLPAHILDGQTVSVSGRLLDYPVRNEDYTRFTVKLISDNVPTVNAVFYSSESLDDGIVPGDILNFTAKLKPSDEKYGERYFNQTAKNIFITGSVKSEIEAEHHKFYLPALPVKLGSAVSELTEEIFPADTATFMKSLLIGDKADFYEDLELKTAMQTAGLMHIVAISGMHITFLVGLLKLLLGNTKRSSLICIVLVWFFVLVTGAGPSAVRAGVMQTLLLLAPIFRRENDPVTSLSLALALILAVNPFAAASVGLQLSFAAMAGLYSFALPINRYLLRKIKKRKLKKVLRLPAASVASSLAVMVYTLPLTAIHFGYVSLYSVLSNVLVFWAVSLCFCGGVVCCLIGLIFKMPAVFLAEILAWPIRFIIFVAKFVADLPLAAVYMDSSYGALWLIFTYILFILAFLSKAKTRFKVIFPTVISAIMLVFSFQLNKFSYENADGVITALDIGQGQCICLMSGDKTVLYDCGGMGTLQNAGNTAGAYLNARGRKDIDLLILSHMQKDHVNGVAQLMELCNVKRIIIPLYDYTDNRYFSEVKEAAESKNIKIEYLRSKREESFNNLDLTLYPNNNAREINNSSIKLLASFGDYDLLATGDCDAKTEQSFLRNNAIEDIELLIAGHHGSKTSNSHELLFSTGADTVFISCGYNSYGHPTEEALERFAKYSYNIYRTDLNSTIELRIGRNYGKIIH